KRISLGCNGRGGLGRDVLAAQFGDELVLIACEAVTFMKILVKGANKSLVAGAHPPNDCAQAGLDLVSVLAFQVVVNQDDHGDRIGFGGKRGDLLLDIVIKNAEFVLAEVGYQVAAAVFYRDRDDHRLGDDLDLRWSLALGRGLRGLRRGWRLGRGGGCRFLSEGHGRQKQQRLCKYSEPRFSWTIHGHQAKLSWASAVPTCSGKSF